MAGRICYWGLFQDLTGAYDLWLDPTIPSGCFCVVVMRHGRQTNLPRYFVAAMDAASGAADEALGRVGSRYERGTPRHGTCFFLAHTAQADVGKHVIAPGALKTSAIAEPISSSE
jgi:hypothetical protein